MGSWVLQLGLMAGLTSATFGCTSSSNVFTCASDGDCTGEGIGTCQSNGFCAFPDAMCPSGARYGELAGGGFANLCVPENDTTGTEGSTGTITTGPTSSSSSTSQGQATTVEPSSGTGPTSSSSGNGTSSEGGSSSETSDGSTTGPPDCASFFDEAFDTELLEDWEVIGTGTVEVSTGSLDLTPTEVAGDQPTWLRRTTPIDFQGAWFRVELDDVPSDDGIQAIVSVTRQNEANSFDVVVDPGTDRIIARAWNSKGFIDLHSVPFDKGETPWIGIREDEGQVVFERGETRNTMVPFFEVDADVTEWNTVLYIGADNYIDLAESDDVRIEQAAACGPL